MLLISYICKSIYLSEETLLLVIGYICNPTPQIIYFGDQIWVSFLLMENTSCPIELEPRTLSQMQLTQAREVAAEIVQKLEPIEASTLFLEEIRKIGENERQVEELIDCIEKDEFIHAEKACHCKCSCNVENTLHSDIKEPLSAPF
ncbi:PREDICTED: uncharacterized protein LOC109328784 isoform X2 [Lupinus angustifolius]|uniref:uncharacterized protein LOC109328784 isoform X2 n=1 Tax=Lupinus angustifolius TaxID=3871 RepID=UPI00092F0B1F|nr:PREDICTED: uncharacterized protein LOC109328784 isoform X2 [Lupinus angustifolius]